MATRAPAKKNVKPVPDGYHSLTPILVVKGGAQAIDFYRKAFGASERFRMDMPGGHVAHAELQIGDSIFMLSDEWPDVQAYSPKHYGGSPQSVMIYVDGVDEVVRGAVAAGATLLRPVEDQFYGDRSGSVTDPFGHVWHVATHVEDMTPEEMKRRSAEWQAKRDSK